MVGGKNNKATAADAVGAGGQTSTASAGTSSVFGGRKNDAQGGVRAVSCNEAWPQPLSHDSRVHSKRNSRQFMHITYSSYMNTVILAHQI